ncbi:DNA polymerase III subunit delta' [Shouchella lonarensis]|uniref:DNA polymerase III subunit delta' n=1 Tax=Shouchella lonarensis TaxID=1464122 RepID=A0A1G6P2X4_9BACI|nr:DNA polymerase III subunit delta' [Shouchella lonarensis]SDC73765.1 DNA polymerase III, delta prime subunit [Shouchella lonarensis]
MQQTWQDLEMAQPRVVPFLIASLKKDRLSHAYLFNGPAGSGKSAMAIYMAKRFLCRQATGVDPCQVCKDCMRIDHGNHPDLHKMTVDKQTIKKEQVTALQKEFSYRGMESQKKVYIIHDVDKMTASAINSLLKFLEEPTQGTLAILLTENREAVLSTLLSRTQQINFLAPSHENMVAQWMKAGVEERHAHFLAALTGNTALIKEVTDGDWSFQARGVVLQLMKEVYLKRDHAFLTLSDKWLPLLKERFQQQLGLEMIFLWLKDFLYMKIGKEKGLVYVDQLQVFAQIARSTSTQQISRGVEHVMEAKRHLNANVPIQLVMERLLFKIQEG